MNDAARPAETTPDDTPAYPLHWRLEEGGHRTHMTVVQHNHQPCWVPDDRAMLHRHLVEMMEELGGTRTSDTALATLCMHLPTLTLMFAYTEALLGIWRLYEGKPDPRYIHSDRVCTDQMLDCIFPPWSRP